MTEDTLLPFDLPAVRRKKVTADFDGGLISSDGGLVLLREAERRLGLAETLAGCIRDWRDPSLVVHTLPAMLRFRMFAIACGYEDADDCDALRTDPLFKLAVGRAPESGRALCSQPTMSRLENAPSRIEVARMTAALVDLFCRSFPTPPAAITLDIDDTGDPVHGHQQLSLFHAHHDTRCFLPVHVYHVESGRPVAVLLRPGKTPSGAEVRTLLKHLVRRIRRHWPRTRLTFRGDSHYGRAEAMAWCEENGVDYIGLLVGGGVSYRAESYTLSGKAHGVLAHAEKGFGEWGISGSVRIDPGILGRGLSLTVAPGWGAAQGGAERLQTYRETPGAGPERGFNPEGRLEAEIGYGLRAPHGAGLLTPHAGLSLSGRGTRQWRAGARWRLAPQVMPGVEGTRDTGHGREGPGRALMFHASARW